MRPAATAGIDRGWHSPELSAKSTRAPRRAAAPYAEAMSEFVEVADRVWVARYEWFDVNVSVVAGTAGLLVVDTSASDQAVPLTRKPLRFPHACLTETRWVPCG